MNAVSRMTSLLFLCLGLTACVTLLDAAGSDPIKLDPGRRTLGAFLDDNQLQTIISVNLRKHGRELARSRVNVKSFNNVVLLTGEVPSRSAKELAGDTTRSISKVRQVHNELAVKSRSTFASRVNDNWIRIKVRAQLLFNRDIESERVRVIVDNRVVYLMGLLSRNEADLVSDLAARVKGVEKVVRVIEYINYAKA